MNEIVNLEKIVVLIDADNTQLNKLDVILAEISTYGRIVVKKAFGNWKSSSLKNWEDELKRLAIKPEQQFAYTAKKNATDIALIIGAMDLLYTEIYDAFVLVSSDSDFTPLAIRIREAGVTVFGVGNRLTPDSFKNSCDNFILTENLSDNNSVEPGLKQEPAVKEKNKQKAQTELDKIHELLKKYYEEYQETDGWVNISAAESYVKRVKPDFDPKTFGHKKITEFVKAYQEKYETKTFKWKGTTIFAYKCK